MEVVDGVHAGQSQGLGCMSEILEHFPGARQHTDDTRSHRLPVAQLWVGSRRNWPVILRIPQHGAPR